jgi:hypothetical protein
MNKNRNSDFLRVHQICQTNSLNDAEKLKIKIDLMGKKMIAEKIQTI